LELSTIFILVRLQDFRNIEINAGVD